MGKSQRGHSPTSSGVESQGLTVLLFIGAAPENDLFWGTLGQDINMDIPGFEMNDSIEDITWEKDKKRVARFQTRNKPKNQDDKYIVSANGTLKVKQLRMEDEGAYKVLMYNKNGKNELERTFQLKIQGKSMFPKSFHLHLGAIE